MIAGGLFKRGVPKDCCKALQGGMTHLLFTGEKFLTIIEVRDKQHRGNILVKEK